jgi:hypothetical protein
MDLFTVFTQLTAGPSAPPAYIDPSTGGMLFQLLAVLLAAFSGVLFFFSRQIKAGLASFRRKLRKETPPPPGTDEHTP